MTESIFPKSINSYTDCFKWVTEASSPEELDLRLQVVIQKKIATDLKDLASKSMAERFVSSSPKDSVEMDTTSTVSETSFKKPSSKVQSTQLNPHSKTKEDTSLTVRYTVVRNLKDYKVAFGNSDNFFGEHNPFICKAKLGESNVFYVYVLTKVDLEGISPKNLLINEGEIDGTFTGYFAKQFADPTIPKGHGGNKTELPYDDRFVDIIGGCFDADIPLEDGTARWEIPVMVKTTDGQKSIKTTVVQEYRVESGNFIISKGGSELFRFKPTEIS